MEEHIHKILEADFMPHGHCYFWRPEIVWTHAIADGIIALAYFCIPLTLVHIVRKRKDFSYIWMGVLFAVFILGCGTTHVFDVINIWVPMYRIDSAVRVITALASIGTAIMLVKITPQILVIPTVEKWKKVNEDLLLSNKSLQERHEELSKTEKILMDLNADLGKRVEERTREAIESSKRFEYLLETIPQMAWTADKEGKVNYYNKRWFSYTGQSFKEASGHGWQPVIHPDDLKTTWDEWNSVLASGQEYEVKNRFRRGFDGEYRWHIVRATPLRNEKGEIDLWVGTCTDIHDQILKNEQLERTNADLDNFIYTASHDLKSPIANLEGLIHTAQDEIQGYCTKDVSNVFSMMGTSVGKLKTTIMELADISRIQKNSEEDIQPVRFVELIEEFKVNCQSLIQKANAKVRVDLQVSDVLFSKRNLRSVVYNLLSNALKYKSEERVPEISVTTEPMGEFVLLTVKDNGVGVPEGKEGKIFGMFKRYHDHVEGTGVGLYIVKRILDNNGGKIEVESEEGKGATFKVYLKKLTPDTGIS